MKKKLLSMLLIIGFVFVFAACSRDDSGYNPNDVDETEAEKDIELSTDNSMVADVISRGTWTSEDDNGYKIQGEVMTTDLIRASDWDTIERTFNSLNPAESLPSFGTVSPDGANQDTSAVLVGRIDLTNTTDGWDFTESSPYECRLYFGAPHLYGLDISSLCIMYGDGMKKYDFGGNRGYLNTNAIMSSNSWGVPFIIVFPEVFTPNEPNGSANVLNATLEIVGGVGRYEFAVPGLME